MGICIPGWNYYKPMVGTAISPELANYDDPSGYTDQSDLAPNPWGFYDFIGNVGEWTSTWSHEYSLSHKIDPQGPKSGTSKINRGGSYAGSVWRANSVYRGNWSPENGHDFIGFRLSLQYTNQAPTDLNSTAPLAIC